MKPEPEYPKDRAEGPQAWNQFNAAMRKVIVVTPAELKRRIAVDNAAHPRKRGRPRKASPWA